MFDVGRMMNPGTDQSGLWVLTGHGWGQQVSNWVVSTVRIAVTATGQQMRYKNSSDLIATSRKQGRNNPPCFTTGRPVNM